MDQQPKPTPNSAEAQPAVLHATIHIKRKATGLVETYQLVGTPVPAEPAQKEPT